MGPYRQIYPGCLPLDFIAPRVIAEFRNQSKILSGSIRQWIGYGGRYPMHTLLIGYGNTLRKDDGLGFRVAEAVETWRVANVKALPCHQLPPDLAADIAEADRVIFVDATLPQDPHSPIIVERLLPETGSPFFQGHHSDPKSLLCLSQALYGQQPIAYSILLPSWDMGYGESLSPIAQVGLHQGLRLLRELLTS